MAVQSSNPINRTLRSETISSPKNGQGHFKRVPLPRGSLTVEHSHQFKARTLEGAKPLPLAQLTLFPAKKYLKVQKQDKKSKNVQVDTLQDYLKKKFTEEVQKKQGNNDLLESFNHYFTTVMSNQGHYGNSFQDQFGLIALLKNLLDKGQVKQNTGNEEVDKVLIGYLSEFEVPLKKKYRQNVVIKVESKETPTNKTSENPLEPKIRDEFVKFQKAFAEIDTLLSEVIELCGDSKKKVPFKDLEEPISKIVDLFVTIVSHLESLVEAPPEAKKAQIEIIQFEMVEEMKDKLLCLREGADLIEDPSLGLDTSISSLKEKLKGTAEQIVELQLTYNEIQKLYKGYNVIGKKIQNTPLDELVLVLPYNFKSRVNTTEVMEYIEKQRNRIAKWSSTLETKYDEDLKKYQNEKERYDEDLKKYHTYQEKLKKYTQELHKPKRKNTLLSKFISNKETPKAPEVVFLPLEPTPICIQDYLDTVTHTEHALALKLNGETGYSTEIKKLQTHQQYLSQMKKH